MKFIFTLFFLQTIFLGNITAQNKDVLEGSNLLLFSFQEDSFLIREIPFTQCQIRHGLQSFMD